MLGTMHSSGGQRQFHDNSASRPFAASAPRYVIVCRQPTSGRARALAARAAVGSPQILQSSSPQGLERQQQLQGSRLESASSDRPPRSSSPVQLVRAPANLQTALATLQQAGCMAVDLYRMVSTPMAQALSSSTSSSLVATAAGSASVAVGDLTSPMDLATAAAPLAASSVLNSGITVSSSSSFTDTNPASSSSSSASSSKPLPPDLAYVQYVPALPSAVDYGASKAQGPRPWQEDRCVACSLPVLGPGSSLVAVFDGHGGQAAAEAAAARVPDLLGQHLAQGEAAGFHRAFHAFDRWLIDQITSGALHWDRSGCTAVAGVCCGEELLVGHVGDSSALLVDMEGGVTRLTENHNTFNESEVERVRASGALVEFSRGCPVPRVWDRPPHLGGRGSMVTRALGDLDFKRAARGITNEPAVLRHTLRPGADLALVTVSDGVTDVLSDDDIGRLVVRAVRKNRQGRSVSRAAADMGLGFLVASEVVVGAVVARSRDNMAAAAMVFNWS